MAAAMGAMIWQRRPRLAKLKLEGLPQRELWYTIVLESLMLLGAGCFTGAVFGLFGQQLADRAFKLVINYPVVSSVGVVVALSSLAVVTASACADGCHPRLVRGQGAGRAWRSRTESSPPSGPLSVDRCAHYLPQAGPTVVC